MARRGSKTRSFTSNRRLRSFHPSPASSSYSPSPVPYGSRLAALGRGFSSPSPSYPYAYTRTPYRRPARAESQRSSRRPSSRSTSNPFLKALRGSTFTRVQASPLANDERTALVCVRRQERREVLHALGKTGTSGQKSPVYNRESKIHCRRKK